MRFASREIIFEPNDRVHIAGANGGNAVLVTLGEDGDDVQLRIPECLWPRFLEVLKIGIGEHRLPQMSRAALRTATRR